MTVSRAIRVGVLVLLGVCVLAVGTALLLADSRWGEDRVRRLIVDRATDALRGTLRIDRLSGSLVGGNVTLEGVSLSQDGIDVLDATAVHLRYSIATMMSGLTIAEVTLVEPRINIVQDPRTGAWNVTELTRETGPDTGSRLEIAIEQLRLVDARVHVDPADAAARTVDRLDARLRLDVTQERVDIDIQDAALRDADTGLMVERAEAALAIGDGVIDVTRLEVETAESHVAGRFTLGEPGASEDAGRRATFDVEADVATSDVAPYAAILQDRPPAFVTVDAAGATDEFQAEWTLESEAGAGAGTLVGSMVDDRVQIQGDLKTQGLDLTAWIGQPTLEGAVDVTGTYEASLPLDEMAQASVEFDATVPAVTVAGHPLTGLDVSGRYANDRVEGQGAGGAYGARATGSGRWDGATGAYAANGRFSGANAAALPERLQVPALTSDLAGQLTLAGDPSGLTVDAVLVESTLEGATIEDGFVVHVESRTDELSYSARGAIASLDPSRFATLFQEPPDLLTRAAGTVTADVALEARGTELASTAATADVTIHRASLPGLTLDDARIQAALDAGTLVADVDASSLSVTSDPLGYATGPLEASGVLRGQVRIPEIEEPSLARMSGEATLAIDGAAFRDTTLERAEVAATLGDGLLQVRQLTASGPGLAIQGSGTVALAGEDGRSAFDFNASLEDLAAIRPLVGEDLELAGGVRVEGRITGPVARPVVTGTLSALDLTAGPVEAVSFGGEFETTVPGWDFEQLVASATAEGTLVRVSGRGIDEVEATVDYEAGRLDVTVMLAQGGRTVDIEGIAEPRSEFREIRLSRLEIGDDVGTWRLAGDGDAVIEYGEARIAVDGLRLMSGGATLDIAGAVGANAERPLRVVAQGVPMAELNRLALGTYELTGRIDAEVTVTGAIETPNVEAVLTVVDGSVEGQPFERVGVEASYANSQADVIVNLRAASLGTFAARGIVPFRLNESSPPAPDYDLTVTSDALAIGFFDPLVGPLDDLEGTAELDLRVTGPADAPDVRGSIAVAGGGFLVEATGVTYQALDADLTIEGEQLTVRQLRMEDSDGNEVRAVGSLNVPGLSDEDFVDLVITTDDLQVLDNEFGDVALSLNLQLLGSMSVPLVAGTITVDRGLIEVSDLLDRLASTGYQPVETMGEDEANQSAYARSSLSVTLAMPDNLVIRGRDLRSRSGPIGLGDVNLTVGGALQISKDLDEEPSVVGRVDVVRGQYQFQGRPFAIVRGSTLRFTGPLTTPLFDVTAERSISGVLARVNVTGTLAEPEILLTSTPPLPQGDILSMIVFNQPMNQLPGAERISLAARAGALAAGAIATPIADSVARALDLDVFEIRPTASDAGGASVRIGRQVSDQLFLGFSQEFGRDEVSQVTFEYRLSELLSIITSWAYSGENTAGRRRAEQAGIDLIFTVR